MSERQARLQRQAKDRLILRFVITVSLAVFVLLTVYLVFNNIADNIAIHSRETVTPRAGMMEESGKAQAVIVQKETVYYAPGEGNFTPCIREGERVRRNIEAGIFVSSGGGKINVKVPATGVFTQNTDGLEKVFEGCTLTELGPEVFAYKSSKANPSGHYYAENAVFKIIDNFEPQGIVALLADKPPVGLKSKDHVLLQYNGLEPFQAQVLKINPVNEQYYLYLKCQEFNNSLFIHRKIALKIIFDRLQGTIIPEKALKGSSDHAGVYIINDGKTEFVKVKVLKINNGEALVEGVENSDIVLVNTD